MAGGIIPGGKQMQISSEALICLPQEFSKITPRARRIYTDLKDAIEQTIRETNMRIVIDMQGAQTPYSRDRGVGRYANGIGQSDGAESNGS